MKNISIFLFAILFFSQISFAQLPVKQWDARFGGSLEDQLRSIKHTADGGYILGGYSKSSVGGDKSQSKVGSFDYWIVKTDSNGIKQWDKVYGGTDFDYLTSLEVTNDGGFILGGYSQSGISGDKSQASQGEYDYWIVKTDASGNKQWDKTYGGTKNEYLTTIHQTADGGYILGGYAVSNMNGDVTQQSRGAEDYWIVKTDVNGEKQWDARFGGNEDDDLQSLVQTSDGGYLLAGTSSSGANGDKSQDSHGIPDYWVVKTDANGIKQWDKTYGGESLDYCNAVVSTSDGGFLLGGYSYSDISGDKSQRLRGVIDCWVVKIDETGAKEWDKSFGGIGADILTALLQTFDGGYLLAGNSASPISGEKTQQAQSDLSGTYYDYWCVKMDGNGNYLWDRRFGGGSVDQCYTVLENSDHSFSLGGSSRSNADGDKTQNSWGDYDYWIVKTTPAGNINNIYVEDIQPLSFMQGNVLNIPYSVYGTFNPGNVFYATLSLNSGSFNTPDTIGSLNSTSAGTIAATIPSDILNGENYHLRVVASQPSSICPANEENITVGPYSIKLFDQVYGGDGGETFYDMIQTADGGFIFAGTTGSDVSGDVTISDRGVIDYWIIKTDSNFVKQWDARFGGSLDEELASIKQTSDGGYILGGRSNSGITGDKTQASQGSYDYWIVKTDANGVKQWDKRFGGSSLDYLYSVLQTSDGGYLLTGRSSSEKTGDKSQASKGNSDYWVIKTDANGIKLWDRSYGGSDWDTPYDAIATSDGGYLIAGNSISPISGDQTNVPRGGDDFWLVKINHNGIKQWDKRYGGSDDEDLKTIRQTFDGGYILSGSSRSPISGEVSQPPFCVVSNCVDYWIIKIDSNGNKQWDQKFGGTDTEGDATVIQTPDSGYLIAGFSDSEIGGVKTQDPRSSYDDYWVVRINSENEILWDTRFGGLGIDYLKDAIQVSDGSFILGGNSGSFAGEDKSESNHCDCVSHDFWIVKISDAVFANSILTNEISPLIYSEGDLVSVPFTASGNFHVGNVFTAQLSDAFGNFSSPTSMGTLSSSESGTINATIPLATPAGTQYRIRVVSSNPSVTGTNNGQNVTINVISCDVPTGTSSSSIKSTSAKVNWDVVTSAQTYSVRYRVTANNQWTKVSTALNSKKLQGLSPPTQYDWEVKSVCDPTTNVSSDWSAAQNFTTKPLKLENETDEEEISLEVFPNPVSSTASVSFSLNEDSKVLVELFSVEGKKVMTIAEGNFSEGDHDISFRTERLSSGGYLLRFEASHSSIVRKMIVEE